MLRCLVRRGALAAAIALGALIAPAAASAQSQPTHPDLPGGFAITNARIVTVSGGTIASGTVVVEDGIIRAVGANVGVPAGAWTIDGTGMTVYPGLIDAFSTLGHPQPRGGGAQGQGGGNGQQEHSWGPGDRPATFTWTSAADEISATDDRIQKWSDAGFTSAVTTRSQGFFPGRAAVINLNPRTDRPRAMVVAPLEVQRINLGSRISSGYPGSLLGSFAYIKQLYEDGAYYDRLWRAYERNPAGQPRPEYDRALEPLRGSAPVLFPANDRKEIERAIRTAAEIDRPVIVYGAQSAWNAADVLRAASTPVLIDLDWPAPPRDGDPQAEPDLATLRAWEHAPSTPARLHEAGVQFALYAGSLSNPGDAMARVRQAIAAGLPEDAALRALTLSPARIYGVGDRLGSIEPGKIANLVITDGDLFAEGTKVRRVIVDGRPREVFETGTGNGGRMARGERADADSTEAPATGAAVAIATVDGPYRSDRVTLIRDATVMTVTNGTIEGGDVLIRDGRIAAVGQDVRAPADAVVIDGTGMFVTPGIIDAHSHIAADAINEGTVNVSAMVGMRDVINPDDHRIYRALAGGVTTVNLLHGSANPIGGRNATLKLRWGSDAEEMIFAGAPEGIKFALGENTKRERNPIRYPVTRMGVQDVIREAFLDAQEYMRAWEAWERRGRRDRGAVAPRRDLKLETLAEILRGERLVHAHTYRADETLHLMRLAEEMGFTIQSFQHILEGYKVADEIAAHGAGASTFSDWWAYKVEAWDAIPHNAALMTERGVVVSINSDDAEEMRHLNQEAAKTMKWGGLSEEEALRLITINPAIQLGIDDRVGSIEVGKDADLVLFNANPLTIDAVVQQTYVDGNRYFDIELDAHRTAAIEQEREALMQKHQPARRDDAAPASAGEEVVR